MSDISNELVSKRWAHALMELACEDENISKEEILDDLHEITTTIDSSEELKEVINNPSISTDEKQAVLSKIFQNNVMPIVYNFLFTLNLRRRVGIISSIADEFQKELEKIQNITHVKVTSAIDLADIRRNDIQNKIAEKLHKDVRVDWTVDNDIIAGLVMNIDETVIDNSVKHKLEDLQKNIMR